MVKYKHIAVISLYKDSAFHDAILILGLSALQGIRD